MKKNFLFNLLLVAASMLSAQAQRPDGQQATQQPVRAQNLLLRPTITLHQPLQGDSINMTGKRLNTGDLLKSKVSLYFDASKIQLLQADTAGYMLLDPTFTPAPADGKASAATDAAQPSRMYLVKTLLRAERFAKGTDRKSVV